MHYIHNREELVTHITDRVAEIRESFPDVQSFPDLHHELFNTDYYIVGTYQAKQWLGDYAFDAIREIKDYEEANFGEVVNMYTYIAGEQLIEEMDFVTVEAIRPEEFFIDAADFNAMLLGVEA